MCSVIHTHFIICYFFYEHMLIVRCVYTFASRISVEYRNLTQVFLILIVGLKACLLIYNVCKRFKTYFFYFVLYIYRNVRKKLLFLTY